MIKGYKRSSLSKWWKIFHAVIVCAVWFETAPLISFPRGEPVISPRHKIHFSKKSHCYTKHSSTAFINNMPEEHSQISNMLSINYIKRYVRRNCKMILWSSHTRLKTIYMYTTISVRLVLAIKKWKKSKWFCII